MGFFYYHRPTLGGWILTGLIIVYSLWLFLATLAFWFGKIENFTELFYTFYEAGRFPVTVYRGWIRTVLTFVVPRIFVTSLREDAELFVADRHFFDSDHESCGAHTFFGDLLMMDVAKVPIRTHHGFFQA